ncbi:glutamine amidotransferase [candidate division WWE3 bacterium]|nr:glutamine amidotransferase [candidate division WWE3 bacterium]MBT7350292.1 glutamine amidotransferase [candidate division WWE3 bacterium]
MKLTIGYFYPELLNLYGDDGNVQILASRARSRGIEVEVINITPKTELTEEMMHSIDLVFMGGGPDSSQHGMYEDLLHKKGPLLSKFIEDEGVGLFICGSYQLLGNYYKAANGKVLDGVGVFDVHTVSFGTKKPRCIGNVVCEIMPELRHDETFNSVNKLGDTLVGFENHGGRTYLGKNILPFAKVLMGHGNNSEDGYEGMLYKNSIGTYLHGPILARNPHLADYLIAKSLNLESLEELDDSLINSAHTASKKLKQ